MRPLDDPGAFDFGEYTDEREHRSSDRRREIERLAQRYEPDPEMLQFIQQRHEVLEVATNPIEGGHGDEIELAAAGIGHERIEPWALLPRATHGVIGELRDNDPAGTGSMLAEGAELVLGSLIARADATVERDP